LEGGKGRAGFINPFYLLNPFFIEKFTENVNKKVFNLPLPKQVSHQELAQHVCQYKKARIQSIINTLCSFVCQIVDD
jgi:hypothetical protein